MSMNNRLTNAYKLPNDVKWIKSFLLGHVQNMLDDLKSQQVYRVEKDGSVVFPADVKVENKKENVNVSMTELYKTLQTLSTEISNISGVGDLENIMSTLADIKSYAQSMKNDVMGVTRDNSTATTSINDELVLSNGLTIPSENTSNGAIFGYGAEFGLVSSSTIKCSTSKDGVMYTATWRPPAAEYSTNELFSINLLNGEPIKTGDDVSGINFTDVQTHIMLEAIDNASNALMYKIEIVADGGDCQINGGGLKLKLHLSKASRFTRGAFESIPESSTDDTEILEPVKFPQEDYSIDNSDKYISFTCSGITYNSLQNRIVITEQHPKLVIDGIDRSFNITNMHEVSQFSTITFIKSSTYTTELNAYVSGATQEQKEEFAKDNGFDNTNEFWESVENAGIIINPYPGDGENGIVFEGDGVIKFGETGEMTMNDSEVNVTFDNETGININTEGIETKSVKLIPSSDDHTNTMQQTDDHIFSFNNDAEFTWKDQNQEVHTIRISELGESDMSVIKALLNRIITLERANSFQRTNLTDNMNIFSNDAPGFTDSNIRALYYALNNPQYHVNPDE